MTIYLSVCKSYLWSIQEYCITLSYPEVRVCHLTQKGYWSRWVIKKIHKMRLPSFYFNLFLIKIYYTSSVLVMLVVTFSLLDCPIGSSLLNCSSFGVGEDRVGCVLIVQWIGFCKNISFSFISIVYSWYKKEPHLENRK